MKRIDTRDIISVLKETAAIVEKTIPQGGLTQINAEIICNHRIVMRGF